MTLIQLSNLFDAVSATTLGLRSYWFGWPSDRLRPRATNSAVDMGAGALYPRMLFAVPEMTQDWSNNKDTYECTLYFDDLLGYTEAGEADDSTQLEKWRTLMNMATAWLKTLRSSLSSLLPDGVAIVGDPRFTLDSFAGSQRLISVVVTLQVVTNSSCGTTANFPEAIPDGIAWPPQDVISGEWIKSEQVFENTTSPVLLWTANALDLSTAWSLDIFMNGQGLIPRQYITGSNSVTIDAATWYEGANFYIRALWSSVYSRIRAEQYFDATTSNTVTWTANALDLTDVFAIEVYVNELSLPPNQFTVAPTQVTIDSGWFAGDNIHVKAIWNT